MKATELSEVRRQILAASAEEGQAPILDLAARSATGDRQAAVAFACMVAAMNDWGADKRANLRFAKRATDALLALTAGNRKSRNLWRDALVVQGNVLARYKEHQKALASYLAAREGESSPERRSLVDLNIAKVHLADGEFYHSLVSLRRVLKQRSRPPVEEAAYLMKARILLSVGADHGALALIRQSRAKAFSHPTNELERRYVSLMARIRPTELKSLPKRLDDFRKFLAEREDSATVSFYELELMLLTQLVCRETITNRRRFLERAQYLAKREGAGSLYRAVKAVDRLFGRARASRDLDGELVASVTALRENHHLLTYQAVSLLLGRLLQGQRRFELAAVILKELSATWDWGLAGFSRKMVRDLEALPNELPSWLERMLAKSPRRVKDEYLVVDLDVFGDV